MNLLRRFSHFSALGDLTGLDRETLVNLTLHRFTSRYDDKGTRLPLSNDTLPLLSWASVGRRSSVRSPGRAVVCPLCWRERRAILLPWSLYHVTICLQHGLLLVDRCPTCHKALHLDVRQDGCLQCGHPIAAWPTWSIAGHLDSISLTCLIWRAIGCMPGPDPPARALLTADHPLCRVGPASLLQGLWDCAQCLVRCRYPVVRT